MRVDDATGAAREQARYCHRHVAAEHASAATRREAAQLAFARLRLIEMRWFCQRQKHRIGAAMLLNQHFPHASHPPRGFRNLGSGRGLEDRIVCVFGIQQQQDRAHASRNGSLIIVNAKRFGTVPRRGSTIEAIVIGTQQWNRPRDNDFQDKIVQLGFIGVRCWFCRGLLAKQLREA